MAVKPIKQLTFQQKQYPELLAKLNAVAPHQYIKVHQLAQAILLKRLDELIAKYGITVKPFPAQSASAG